MILILLVIQLPYSSNISDIEPFLYEEDVCLRFVQNVAEFGKPDAVIIPGTKSTIRDLQFIKRGLDFLRGLLAFARGWRLRDRNLWRLSDVRENTDR